MYGLLCPFLPEFHSGGWAFRLTSGTGGMVGLDFVGCRCGCFHPKIGGGVFNPPKIIHFNRVGTMK